MWTPKDNVDQPLYVVCCITNFIRFKARWKHYRDFQRHIRESGAILLTVEGQFGERQAALEDHAQPGPLEHTGDYKSFGPANVPPAAAMPQNRLKQDYIKVQVDDQQEIWLKENLLNIGVQHLPPDWKYVAFIDADVLFNRPDWVSETLHALQHFDVVQMFSTAINMGPDHMPMEINKGYMYCHWEGYPRTTKGDHYIVGQQGLPNTWHTGFAWAWRRKAFNDVGGLIEHGVLGAGDNHMARGLVGRIEESLNPKLSEGYKRLCRQWQERAVKNLNYNVGYIDGMITHAWHGRITNRRYSNRWRILIEHNFDPDYDMHKDHRGILRLTDNKPGFRDDVRRYFRSRNEDSVDSPRGDYRLVGAKPSWTPVRGKE